MGTTVKSRVLSYLEDYEQALQEDYRKMCYEVSQLSASAEVISKMEDLDQHHFMAIGAIFGVCQMAADLCVIDKDEAKKRGYDFAAALSAINIELLGPAQVRWESELGAELAIVH